jgi:hypothetical protein
MRVGARTMRCLEERQDIGVVVTLDAGVGAVAAV